MQPYRFESNVQDCAAGNLVLETIGETVYVRGHQVVDVIFRSKTLYTEHSLEYAHLDGVETHCDFKVRLQGFKHRYDQGRNFQVKSFALCDAIHDRVFGVVGTRKL